MSYTVQKMTEIDFDAFQRLLDSSLPALKLNYNFPEEAAKALSAMHQYQDWLHRPRTGVKFYKADPDRAEHAIKEVAKTGQKFLPINSSMEVSIEKFYFFLIPRDNMWVLNKVIK